MSETRDTQPDAITPERMEAAGFVKKGGDFWQYERPEPLAWINMQSLDVAEGLWWLFDGQTGHTFPKVRVKPATMAEVHQAAALIGIELAGTPAAPAAERVRELEEERDRWKESAEGAWHRLYARRELWTDECDKDALARAQAEADEHGVPVSVNVHGRAVCTCHPKRLTELESDLAALREQNAALEQQLAAARGERERLQVALRECWDHAAISPVCNHDELCVALKRVRASADEALTEQPQ